ncbi:MAG TPA: hypothetical protein VHR86_09450, partial [Armatimonadota bacterium]|nr:hypothetical protein [Armatimonadota bacterium]
ASLGLYVAARLECGAVAVNGTGHWRHMDQAFMSSSAAFGTVSRNSPVAGFTTAIVFPSEESLGIPRNSIFI